MPMARWARETGVTLRFIEYMDVGHSNGWRLDEVVPAAELIEPSTAIWPAEPAEPNYRGEVAGRWRYLDGLGEFGVISSVTMPFCRDCTRARLSADGQLYTCLFAVEGADLRAVLRDGSRRRDVDARSSRGIWHAREDRYSELRRCHARGPARPAQGRDVRDGRLTPARDLARDRVVHRVIHIPDEVVDRVRPLRRVRG